MTLSSSERLVLKCVANRQADLPIEQRDRAWQISGLYPVTVGRSYEVFGMSLIENRLYFLIRDDTEDPCFLQAAMFSPLEGELPTHWMFALRDGVHETGGQFWSNPVVAVWGYPELVLNRDHAGQLEMGEAAALDIFFSETPTGRAGA